LQFCVAKLRYKVMMDKPKYVFIIDDDDDDIVILKDAIKECAPEISCDSAGTCKEAILKLKDSWLKPDIIFMDLNMPIISGKQCIGMLKGDILLADIPVVVYSTSSNPNDINAAKQLGAQHYIIKPSDYKEVCEAVSEVITLYCLI